jgi:hypothetical protein
MTDSHTRCWLLEESVFQDSEGSNGAKLGTEIFYLRVSHVCKNSERSPDMQKQRFEQHFFSTMPVCIIHPSISNSKTPSNLEMSKLYLIRNDPKINKFNMNYPSFVGSNMDRSDPTRLFVFFEFIL